MTSTNKGGNETWLIVAEVADHLGVSKMTVYRMITIGEIKAYRFGRAFRIKREDFAEYIQNSEVKVKVDGGQD
jgi:excisionase family DNA binding protein